MNYYILTFHDDKAADIFIDGMNPSIETRLAGENIYAKMEKHIPCTSILMAYRKFGLTTAQQLSETEYNAGITT